MTFWALNQLPESIISVLQDYTLIHLLCARCKYPADWEETTNSYDLELSLGQNITYRSRPVSA